MVTDEALNRLEIARLVDLAVVCGLLLGECICSFVSIDKCAPPLVQSVSGGISDESYRTTAPSQPPAPPCPS